MLPSNSKVKGLRFFEIFLNFSDFFLRIVSNSKFKDLSFFYIFEFLFFLYFLFFLWILSNFHLQNICQCSSLSCELACIGWPFSIYLPLC